MNLKSLIISLCTAFVSLTLFFLLAPINQSHAAALTWDGGGVDNNWSTCANWTTDACPIAGDTLTFNGTSTKNSTVDPSFTGTITSLTIASGYTGTITLARSLTISSNYSQAAGTFNGDGQVLDINGTYSLTAGVFTAPSTTMSVASTFTISGSPTFNANGGTVTFDGASATLSCNNVTFNLVTFTHTGTKTVSSNCSMPLGANPSIPAISLSGTLSGTGTLSTTSTTTLNTGAVLSGFNGLVAGATFNIAGAALNLSTYTTVDFNGAFVLSSGTYTAPTSTMTAASTFTISGGTFNANGGTVTFDGTTTATLSCNNVTFNLVTFTHTAGVKTVSSNCNLPLGTNPITSRSITLNGTLTGSGVLTLAGNGGGTTILNSGAQLVGFSGLLTGSTINTGTLTISGATVDFSTYAPFTLTGNLVISSGAFTAPSGTMSISNGLTISGGTFDANGGTVEFNGSTSSTLACNNTVFNLVTFSHTGAKIVNSDCTLPLGTSPVVTGGLSLSGALTGSGILTIGSDTNGFNIQSTGMLSGFTGITTVSSITISGATINFGDYTLVDINRNFSILSGSFIAPSSSMSVNGVFTNSDGTFLHNNGTIVLDGVDQSLVGSTTFNNLTKQSSGTLTFEAGSTQTIQGTLTLQGNDSGKLLLRSSVPGTQWNIDPQGPRNMNYLDVQDGNNINNLVLETCNTIDSGNNTNWNFNPSSCNNPQQIVGSTTEPVVCGTPSPGTTPINLYSALPRSGTSVLLTFSSASDPYDHYALEYGTASGDYAYGATNIGGKETRQYLVQALSPNTTYYFRVRAGNGCATGMWSNEISVRTLSSGTTSNLINSSSLTAVGYEIGTGGDGATNGTGASCTYYTVKSGDSLWEIARDKLGRGAKFKTIVEQNKDEYPSLATSTNLTVSWKLKINCDNQDKEKDTKDPLQVDSGAEKTYDVAVIVKDEEDKPVGGASVTLHSTPRHATTNKEGIAKFDKVEKGEHKVIIAYDDQVGEQKMVLAESDNVKKYELTVRLQRRNPLLNPLLLAVIGVMGGVIVVMGWMLKRRNKGATQSTTF